MGWGPGWRIGRLTLPPSSPNAPAHAHTDFEEHFLRLRPALLVVTEDDKYGEAKRALCAEVRYVLCAAR